MTDRESKGGFFAGLLTARALGMVLPVGLAMLVEPLVFKLIQVQAASGKVLVGAALGAWAPDAAVALAAVLLFSILLSRLRGAWRVAAAGLFYLLAAAVLFMDAASHGYFMATGSHLSLASMQVWTEHMEETNNVIAGEVMTWKLPLAIGQFVVVIVLAVAAALPAIRRRLDAAGALGKKAAIVVIAALAGLTLAALLAPAPDGKLMSLARCVPISMIAEAASEEGEGKAGEAGDSMATILEFEEEEGAPRPNIVLIMFESLNWKSSDVYIDGRGTTPFLKSIAEDSAVVDRHYTVLPHTSKAILPILCGFYPYMSNKRKASTPGILPRRCMAHVLRSQGYSTAFFQPAVDFEDRSTLVKNMGFEEFFGRSDLPSKGFEKISYFGIEDKAMLAPSLSWVDSVKDGPFFLTYLTLATHHNYVTPQSFPRVEFPETDPDQVNYLNAVRYVDDFIREVVEGFEARGLMEDTVFIIVGDHGEAFAEHARRQHDLIMWEEGLRALSMIYAPGGQVESGRIGGIRSHLDLVPTVCDLLGLELKSGDFEGRSILKAPQEDRKLLHSCWFNRQCLALREGMVKTIYHYGNQPMEVYDNTVDEFDEHDLAGVAPYDDRYLKAKEKEMISWRTRVNRTYSEWEKELSRGKVTKEKPRIAREVGARFGDVIELVGYEIFPTSAVAGEDLNIKYVFKSLKKTTSTTELFVHVLKRRGHINADHVPVSGTYPPRKWSPGEYIVDEHTVHIPSGWKDETARICVGFWDKKTKERLEVSGEEIRIDDGRLVLTDVPVKRRTRKKTGLGTSEIRKKVSDWIGFEKPEIGEPRNVVFGDEVELVAVSLDRTDVKLAGTVELTYVFKALEEVPGKWRLMVRLIGEDGKVVKGDHVPIGGLYPPGLWRPGEYIVDKHKIHIDMYKTKVGDYRIWMGFRNGSRPVEVSGEGEFDDFKRVYLGDVRINPRTEKQ